MTEPAREQPVGPDAVELVRVRLPLRRPLRSAHGVEEVREVVLVHVIEADGVEGWGECSALERPTYTGEHTDGAWAMLRDLLVPAALHGSGVDVVGHPFATAALADACLDVRLRRDGRSLVASYGADPTGGLSWTAVLGIDDERDLDRHAAEARNAGASGFKVKVRPGSQRWLDRSGELGAGLPVAVDANGSFGADEELVVELAERLAARLDEPASERRVYIEQPLPADDLVGTAALATRLAVPVALDESVTRSGDVATAWALGSAALVNLKPARAGGALAALGFLDPQTGPHAFLGGMVETGIGRATALGVGVALGLDHTDLGPSGWYFDDDLTEPIEIGSDGRMRAPDGPGIGVVPRPDRLAELAVDRLVLRP